MNAPYYSRPIQEPKTKLDGLCNAIQMAINLIEAGDPGEACLRLVDLLDDVRSKSNPYLIGVKPKRKPRDSDHYRGDVNID